MRYDRMAAVAYAHEWAFGRNPYYYNYEDIGGDCTNFVSQCLYAGSGVMDFQPVYGWYYIDANDKAPAWTGVRYLNNYLTRTSGAPGPLARYCRIDELQIGDVIQLQIYGEEYHHSLIVVSVSPPFRPSNILIAAHSFDADFRPLSTYDYKEIRFFHIERVIPPV